MNTEWVQWVAENAVLGVNPDRMIQTMAQAGIDSSDATIIVDWVLQNPLLPTLKLAQQRQNKLASMMTNMRLLQQQDTKFNTVEKIDVPTEEEFFHKYWVQGRPVVIKGIGRDWPALTKWTTEYLATTFGDETVEVQERRESNPLYEMHSICHKSKVPLKQFIARIAEGPSNDFYMTANNHVFRDTALCKLLNDVGTVPNFAVAPRTRDAEWHLWIGPQGTITPMHHDENALLHIQIQGRKRWKLISPLDTPNVYNHRAVFSQIDVHDIDYDRFPLMKKVSILETVVEPGETLFLPLGWWHGVESLDPSISVSFTTFPYPNRWVFNNP